MMGKFIEYSVIATASAAIFGIVPGLIGAHFIRHHRARNR